MSPTEWHLPSEAELEAQQRQDCTVEAESALISIVHLALEHRDLLTGEELQVLSVGEEMLRSIANRMRSLANG